MRCKDNFNLEVVWSRCKSKLALDKMFCLIGSGPTSKQSDSGAFSCSQPDSVINIWWILLTKHREPIGWGKQKCWNSALSLLLCSPSCYFIKDNSRQSRNETIPRIIIPRTSLKSRTSPLEISQPGNKTNSLAFLLLFFASPMMFSSALLHPC